MIAEIHTENTNEPTAIIRITYNFGTYKIQICIYNDTPAITYSTGTSILTDEPHCIEFLLARATTSISSDGYFKVWVDGVEKESLTGIDNYDRCDRFGVIELGAMLHGGTSTGTIYLDELIVIDVNEEIGCIPYNFYSISDSVQVSDVISRVINKIKKAPGDVDHVGFGQ